MSKLYVFDFSLSHEICDDYRKVKKVLEEISKTGKFSHEKAWVEPKENEVWFEPHWYNHFQGRISLKERSSIGKLVKTTPNSIKGIHWGTTSTVNKDNTDYVEKEWTHVDGPWELHVQEDYIPRQIREVKELYEWQTNVINKLNIWDKRSINMLYCPNGNIGKSTLIGYVRAYKLGRALPPVNDYRDMLRMVCDLPISKNYFVDMPRALKKDKLGSFYSAIETIKDGYAYDDRYTFKEKIFDCPNIWIFSNILPELELLSKDRWKIWNVCDNKLKPYSAADFVL